MLSQTPDKIALHPIINVQQQSVFVLLSFQATFLELVALLSQNVHCRREAMTDALDEFTGTVPLLIRHQPKHLVQEIICHGCIRVGLHPDKPCFNL